MAKTSRRQSGDGALYQRADGLWVASVDLGYTTTGGRRRKVVSSKTQAGALAKLREVRRQVGLYGDVPTTSITLAAWLTRWMDDIAANRVRPKTLATYRHKVALIVEPIGNVRLDKLTPAHVRMVHKSIAAKGLSSTTALQAHRVLVKALKDAEREGAVIRNVAQLVDAPAKAVSDRGALTSAQAMTFLRGLDGDPLASRWLFALLYGVRQGEALGLTWDAVHADTLDIAWQLQTLPWRHGCKKPCGRTAATCKARHLGIPDGMEARHLSGATVLTRPKSKKPRSVPLLAPIAAALDDRRRLAAGQDNPHGLVWATPAGKPLNPSSDWSAWRSHLDRAGLPPLPLHSARHTAATMLLELGVDSEVAKQILGHSEVTTTRGYQHVDMTLMRAALTGVAELLGVSPSG